ncbi:hypothetical protein NQ314_005157 [Rhamnusium bicolor]|uniref:Regulatory protein zeste n=1 Tax=Rhamnusium bicolor TaxID=1586634 RepID=A0AAV8ZKH1_9CUCU|nr:hypothetical protein NQ314_005157 [Rhamnusium bicolor]
MRDSHWDIILEYMEAHNELATGKFIGAAGRQNNKKLWQSLTAKLNSLGYGSKSTEKWQKVSICSIIHMFLSPIQYNLMISLEYQMHS